MGNTQTSWPTQEEAKAAALRRKDQEAQLKAARTREQQQDKAKNIEDCLGQVKQRIREGHSDADCASYGSRDTVVNAMAEAGFPGATFTHVWHTSPVRTRFRWALQLPSDDRKLEKIAKYLGNHHGQFAAEVDPLANCQ